MFLTDPQGDKPLREDGSPVMDEASKLLLKAADLIEKHGLAKHRQFDTDGSMCAYGALVFATTGRAANGVVHCSAGIEAVRRLETVVGQATGGLGMGWGVANWNNAPERTKEEVVAKLRAVALG